MAGGPEALMRARLLSALCVALAAFVAAPTFAYVIHLKGGGQLTAREKPTVQGKFLVFYTTLGVMQRIRLADYDEKKTLEMNAQGTGDAYVLGDAPTEKAPPTGPAKPSLSQYIKEHQKAGIGEERKPVEVAREGKGAARLQEPAAGPSLDPQLEAGFLHTLESYGVKAPRVSAVPSGIRVQGVTESEEQVFAAIRGIAKAMTESRARQPIAKADIYLSTSTGEAAGHFEMSSEDADALVSGRKTPPDWFMANLIL